MNEPPPPARPTPLEPPPDEDRRDTWLLLAPFVVNAANDPGPQE